MAVAADSYQHERAFILYDETEGELDLKKTKNHRSRIALPNINVVTLARVFIHWV